MELITRTHDFEQSANTIQWSFLNNGPRATGELEIHGGKKYLKKNIFKSLQELSYQKVHKRGIKGTIHKRRY